MKMKENNLYINIFSYAVFIIFVCFCVLVLFEFAVGCGEHYIDSVGVVHVNQCLFFGTAK